LSVPFASRRRLPRCFQTTRPATRAVDQTTAGGLLRAKAAATRVVAAAIEPTETYRVRARASAKTTQAIPVAAGARGTKAPAPVATPFPPRKRSQMGYMCPTTAATAARGGRVLPGGSITLARNAAAAPLAASRA